MEIQQKQEIMQINSRDMKRDQSQKHKQKFVMMVNKTIGKKEEDR